MVGYLAARLLHSTRTTGPAVVAVLLVVLALALLLRRKKPCLGLHCPGCRH